MQFYFCVAKVATERPESFTKKGKKKKETGIGGKPSCELGVESTSQYITQLEQRESASASCSRLKSYKSEAVYRPFYKNILFPFACQVLFQHTNSVDAITVSLQNFNGEEVVIALLLTTLMNIHSEV